MNDRDDGGRLRDSGAVRVFGWPPRAFKRLFLDLRFLGITLTEEEDSYTDLSDLGTKEFRLQFSILKSTVT